MNSFILNTVFVSKLLAVKASQEVTPYIIPLLKIYTAPAGFYIFYNLPWSCYGMGSGKRFYYCFWQKCINPVNFHCLILRRFLENIKYVHEFYSTSHFWKVGNPFRSILFVSFNLNLSFKSLNGSSQSQLFFSLLQGHIFSDHIELSGTDQITFC